jgi:hypothetical protein
LVNSPDKEIYLGIPSARQGFTPSPVEIYGEMELLRLLDQFFDRALCFAAEGYEQYIALRNGSNRHAREAQTATR